LNFINSPFAKAQGVVLTASNGGKGTGESCAAAAVGGTETGVQYCQAKAWPQTMPVDVIGLNWSDATQSYRELGCFNLGKSISVVDGHDVGDETINNFHHSEIVAVSPAGGVKVMPGTQINLKVRPTDH
jgi:hypothetical protein